MSDTSPADLTRLLDAFAQGDTEAADRLAAAVYADLHAIAAASLRREAAGHTLQPTEIVHEAFLRLQQHGASWKNRGHFFTVAAKVMRHVLVDHARKRQAAKRDHGVRVTFDELAAVDAGRNDLGVLVVHDAIERRAAFDARQAQVVELRYFAGLSIEEVAEVQGTSPATVKRDWTFARAFLLRALGAGADGATTAGDAGAP